MKYEILNIRTDDSHPSPPLPDKSLSPGWPSRVPAQKAGQNDKYLLVVSGLCLRTNYSTTATVSTLHSAPPNWSTEGTEQLLSSCLLTTSWIKESSSFTDSVILLVLSNEKKNFRSDRTLLCVQYQIGPCQHLLQTSNMMCLQTYINKIKQMDII